MTEGFLLYGNVLIKLLKKNCYANVICENNLVLMTQYYLFKIVLNINIILNDNFF